MKELHKITSPLSYVKYYSGSLTTQDLKGEREGEGFLKKKIMFYPLHTNNRFV